MPGPSTNQSATPTLATNSKPRPKFDEFDPYETTAANALEACRKFVKSLLASPWSGGYLLTLTGTSGNGKTLLARMVIGELDVSPWGTVREVKPKIEGGHKTEFDVRFFDLRTISDRMKGGDWDLDQAMISPQLAILDDLGADYDPKKIFAGKIDKVLRNRRGRWTIITSNLELEQIRQQLDTRIASWLIRDENKLANIRAGDYALRKKEHK